MNKLFILFMLLPALSFSQQTWYRCYGDENCGLDVVTQAICHNGSHRLAFGGRLTGCPNSPYDGAFVAEYLDENGDILWKTQSLGARGIISDVAVLQNTNIAFEYMEGDSLLGLSLAVFDTSGNYLFSRNIKGRSFVSKRMIPYKTDVFLTGYEWNSQSYKEGVVAKYGTDGTFKWVKCYGIPSSQVVFNGGFPLGDNICLYGYKIEPGYAQSYGLLVVMDQAGTILQEHCYRYWCNFEEVRPLPGGGYAALVQAPETTTDTRVFVYFIHANFTPQKIVALIHNDNINALNLDVSPSGKVYTNGFYHCPSGNDNPFMLCFSETGNFLWARTNVNNDSIHSDKGIDISVPDDCNLWAAGWHFGNQTVQWMDPLGNAGGIDTVLVPFTLDTAFQMPYSTDTSLTEIIYNLTDTIIPLILDTSVILHDLNTWSAPYSYPGCYTANIHPVDDPSEKINIYPNPTTNILIFETPERSAIEIFNIESQLIKTINTAEKQTIIDVSDLSSGVYIIKAKTVKGIAVKKFIKE